MGFLANNLAGRPGLVDDIPGSDGIANIVGTVGKRSRTRGDDLDERVGMFNLVRVLLGVVVDTSHAATFGRASNSRLGSVNVVIGSIEGTDDNLRRDALENKTDIVEFVDASGTQGIVVQIAHGPSEGTGLGAQFCVQTLATGGHEFGIGGLACLVGNGRLFQRTRRGILDGRGVGGDDFIVIVLHHGVIGHSRLLTRRRHGTLEESRTSKDIVAAQVGILLDHLSVQPGHKEETREDKEATTDAQRHGGNEPGRTLVETEIRRAFVDNRQGTDGSRDEEEKGRGPDSPGKGILAQMDDELDEHEDGGTKTRGNDGSHAETCKDGSQAFAIIPSPLDARGTHRRDAHAGNGRDEGVGGTDMGAVHGTPHHPGRSSGKRTGKGEHLDAGIVSKGIRGDDAVLDGLSSTSADGNGT